VPRHELLVRCGEAPLRARDLAEPALLLSLGDAGMEIGGNPAQVGALFRNSH
jgi:hypothetical protein